MKQAVFNSLKKRACLYGSVHGDCLVALKVLGYLLEVPL